MTRNVVLAVVEGNLEVPATEKLLGTLGYMGANCTIVNKRGRESFWESVGKYNQAASQLGPVFALADLEREPCPSGLIGEHLRGPQHVDYVLRIAERMLESWLLADRESLAKYLRVSADVVPNNPDVESNPKQTLVNLARKSKSRDIREEMTPEPGTPGIVGKNYTGRLTEFLREYWRPLVAQKNSESLRRAIAALRARCEP
jgi:hypothetical protein